MNEVPHHESVAGVQALRRRAALISLLVGLLMFVMKTGAYFITNSAAILSDAMEAVLGAVYLDGGAQVAFDLVERLFAPRLDAAVPTLDRLDYKSALQELVSHRAMTGPDYSVRSTGPDHDKRFHATVKVSKQIVGEGNLFLLKVVGDSMIDAAICDGDWVVVRQQPTADNGDIVAALLDNEATVKTFKRKDGHVWLLPHNPDFSPIDGDQATILGKVTAVLRRV